MIHLIAMKSDSTVCGETSFTAQSIRTATDTPIRNALGEDIRCPECWKVWRALVNDGYDFNKRSLPGDTSKTA